MKECEQKKKVRLYASFLFLPYTRYCYRELSYRNMVYKGNLFFAQYIPISTIYIEGYIT
jgi:hypothetical protein